MSSTIVIAALQLTLSRNCQSGLPLSSVREVAMFADQTQAAASLTYWPLPTGQKAHSSLSAAMRSAICASVKTGDGVKRMRSVPRGTVG
jgi:hypothetical protein